MNTIEVKTADLIGAALDWSVDVATASIFDLHPERTKKVIESILGGKWSPSTDWSQGGPLIEKYGVSTGGHFAGEIHACVALRFTPGNTAVSSQKGSTHLIAACRAIVAAKLGDTVQIPAELLP